MISGDIIGKRIGWLRNDVEKKDVDAEVAVQRESRSHVIVDTMKDIDGARSIMICGRERHTCTVRLQEPEGVCIGMRLLITLCLLQKT